MKKITLGVTGVLVVVFLFATGVWYGAHLQKHLAFLEKEKEKRPVGQVFGVSLGYVKNNADYVLVGYDIKEGRYHTLLFHQQGKLVRGFGITYKLAVLDAVKKFRKQFPFM